MTAPKQSQQRLRKLGMPYMGSKRKLSEKIIDEIINANPNCKYFYDLFGGGGAISFEVIQRPKIQKVVYNELNTGVVELLKKIATDGVTDEFYQWIDRVTFNKHKNDDDWFGGLCKVVWSFGDNQKDYLFGKEVEPIKKLAHEAIVFKNKNSLNKLSELIDIELPLQIIETTVTRGRHLLSRIVAKSKNERLELQQLQQLEFSNKSYIDVIIDTPVDETIIYLDPPYEGTKQYQEGDFYHRELEEYIKNSPYKIYVSSYEFDLPKVASFKHTTSLSAKSSKDVTENLYCNQEHVDRTRLF